MGLGEALDMDLDLVEDLVGEEEVLEDMDMGEGITIARPPILRILRQTTQQSIIIMIILHHRRTYQVENCSEYFFRACDWFLVTNICFE